MDESAPQGFSRYIKYFHSEGSFLAFPCGCHADSCVSPHCFVAQQLFNAVTSYCVVQSMQKLTMLVGWLVGQSSFCSTNIYMQTNTCIHGNTRQHTVTTYWGYVLENPHELRCIVLMPSGINGVRRSKGIQNMIHYMYNELLINMKTLVLVFVAESWQDDQTTYNAWQSGETEDLVKEEVIFSCISSSSTLSRHN